MEPAREYDLYVERREREYEGLIKGMDCFCCGHSELPDLTEHNGYDGIGYCLELNEFVFEGDTPETQDCGVFTL